MKYTKIRISSSLKVGSYIKTLESVKSIDKMTIPENTICEILSVKGKNTVIESPDGEQAVINIKTFSFEEV